jgi:tetratricopeptide (TPR) repeat protein
VRRRLLPATLICSAAALLVVAGLLAVTGGAGEATAGGLSTPTQISSPPRNHHTLAGAIELAQTRLRSLPQDDQTWAQLGSAYVQQARITVDPSYYPKAEGALKRSLQLNPKDNAAAMIGMGSLANARHDFRRALGYGRRAAALDPYNAAVYGVLDDALTQLGDYSGADAALGKMLDLQPGIPSFSRASYAFEQRGQVAQARSSMTRALAESTDPADIAFCRYYLGELDFNNGDPKAALRQYQSGLVAAPTSDPLLAGTAKAEAALGRHTDALRHYAVVVSRVPQPEYVLEYAQLLDTLGHSDEAKAQYAVLASIQQLFQANGVVDDLTSAVVEADHGSPSAAVRHARIEWGRRHSVLVADALAWALHRDGQDAKALGHTEQADRLGWRNATFAYHRGMIELSLGRRAAARHDLERALTINPYFSSTQAPKARAALTTLRGNR